jgi:hypothetical protein
MAEPPHLPGSMVGGSTGVGCGLLVVLLKEQTGRETLESEILSLLSILSFLSSDGGG